MQLSDARSASTLAARDRKAAIRRSNIERSEAEAAAHQAALNAISSARHGAGPSSTSGTTGVPPVLAGMLLTGASPAWGR